MTELPVLVAGGGIAGLAAALSLARRGRPVRLFEQAAGFSEAGAGIQMSPNGVRALIELGAWEHVGPSCVAPSGILMRDGRSGKLLQRIALGGRFVRDCGAPYRVCHRADLLSGLLAAARQQPLIELNTGQAAAGVSQTTLRLAGGLEVEGHAIVAADGIRSRLRASVCGVVEPRRRNVTLYRSLLPQLPPAAEADCVTLWLCPGAHVVHYPVSNWQKFNIVVAVDGGMADDGWQSPAAPQEVMKNLTGMSEALLELLAAAPSWQRWAGADLPPLSRWSAERVVLAGDAAHATLPFLAQGAMMALEDAVVLGQELERSPEPAGAFQAYERRRKPRVTRVQEQSRAMGGAYHAGGLKAAARNLVLQMAGPALTLDRLDWIYRWTPDGGG